MDVSISKRMMLLFGLMCASALFFARMSLWRSLPRRAAVPAFIFCRLNTWMRFSLRVMDTLGWSILARAAIRQTAPIRAIPFGRARLLARVSKAKLSLSCKAWV